MTRFLLLAAVVASLSACMSNGETQTSQKNWGNMYTHDVRVTAMSSIAYKPTPKVKGRSLISPGIY